MTVRWRPSRAGLIALWRYWDETFTFHQGRLLLRGPNGSGKSMALELLLPFLLDGDSSPAKLTSSGRTRGRLFDRLMTGTTEQSRTGYAWLEFVRGDEVFTAGARIRGSHSTQQADVDLFTTRLAVGRDLHLLDQNRTPLSRKALIEAIGETGRVDATVADHRAAVREVLFPGFSAERYESVIGALLALRREKLSEKLDPEKLSLVLSEALPPLDEHDIAAVAEGFERLDRRRDAVAELERDVEEVRQLARRQRGYAQVVVVAAAGGVRSAETTRDDVTRHERVARDELAAAESRAVQVRADRDRLDGRIDELGVEVTALKDSAAYRAGADLAELDRHAGQDRATADRARDRCARATERRDRAEDGRDRAAGEVATATANEHRARDEVASAAERVAAEPVVAEAADTAPEEADALVAAWSRGRRTRIAEVRVALEEHRGAVTERGVRANQVADDERVAAQRSTARDQAVEAEAAARAEYAAAVGEWCGQCETVGAARLRGALPAAPDDPVTVSAAVGDVRRELAADDAAAREHTATERAGAEAERARWHAERARWESSELVDPDGPPWRTPRVGRPGAPLWRLVDPAPGVGDDTVDAVESALTGAGLIDAWVRPTGQVDLPATDADVQLGTHPSGGRTLGEVLVPAAPAAPDTGPHDGAPVALDVVGAVLASIPVAGTAGPANGTGEGAGGAGAGGLVIGLDGSYRLGSAVGRGPHRPALLLGAVARERHRLRRLAEIDSRLEEAGRRLAALDRERAALDRRRAAVDAELDAQPSGEPVAAAANQLTAAAARLAQASDALDAGRARLRAAEDRVRTALRQLTMLATRHGLPTTADALAGAEVTLEEFARSAVTWGRRRRDAVFAAREHEQAANAAWEATEEADRAREELAAAERIAADAERRARVLRESVGADYRIVVDRITAAEAERDEARRRLPELRREGEELLRRVGSLGADVTAAAARRAAAEAARDAAQRRLVVALRELGDDAEIASCVAVDTPTAVLAAAREIAAVHEHLDTSGREVERRSQAVADRVHQAQAALGARADFDRGLAEEGWWALQTTAGGVRRRIGELAGALTGQLAEGRAELAADEERLFEQTLAGSVRRALADRIRQANALVAGINHQLGAIKTATAGVGVRLGWDVDPSQPPAVRAARALLLRDPADLTEAERGSLQEFVKVRVEQARAELEASASWAARLRESLDYRTWHRFTLQVAHRDWPGFVPATARRLQQLSTGERSIALHLPMIASVAAHYADEGGRPGGCPRLILLDELFAGVDTANRAQLFGAFTTWELDAVFTSDHEWCQYADLDGIAIHYLHPTVGDEPVTSTRFTWDGNRRVIDPAA